MALFRRRTRYEKRRLRQGLKISAIVLVCVAALWIGAKIWQNAGLLPSAPVAARPEEGSLGYIPVAEQQLEIEISARSAFVYDYTANEILYLKGEDRVIYPASTTKLLTALTVLQILAPETVITPGEELSLVQSGSSLAYIKEHHQLSVSMLIEAMLLPSGNDAAYVLAAATGEALSEGEVTGKEAVALFISHMNAYGETLGLSDTYFTTPDGLAGKEHYSTVEDMLLITRAADQNALIRRYAALQTATVTYASGHTNTWVNTNALLDPSSPYYRPCVDGLKTGSLDHNFCIIASAEQNGRRYLIGVFGAPNKNARFADAAAIIDMLFDGGADHE